MIIGMMPEDLYKRVKPSNRASKSQGTMGRKAFLIFGSEIRAAVGSLAQKNSIPRHPVVIPARRYAARVQAKPKRRNKPQKTHESSGSYMQNVR